MIKYSVDMRTLMVFGSCLYQTLSAESREDLEAKMREEITKAKGTQVGRIGFERIKRTIITDVSAPSFVEFAPIPCSGLSTSKDMRAYGYKQIRKRLRDGKRRK